MATDKLKGISLSIGLETSEFKSGLTEIKRQITLATDVVKFWKQELKIDPSNTTYLKKYNEAVKELTDIASEAKGTVQGLFNEMSDSGYSASDERLKATTKELNSLDNVLNKAIPNYEQFGETIQKANDELANTDDNFVAAGEGALTFGDILKSQLLSSAIQSAFSELINLARKLADTFVDIMKTGIEYNASMETFTTSIKAMLNGDEEAAQNVVNAMKEITSQSSFSSEALLESAQQLIASDESAEKATSSIRNLAKALAYAGKGDDELKRMAQNLNQIKNAGKATAADLKQFAYAGVPIYKLLAESSERFANGVNSKDDPATYDDIIAALQKAGEEGGKFFDAFSVQSETYNGQLNKIKSNWLDLTGVIAEDTTTAFSQYLFPAVNDTLQAMKQGYEENGFVGLFEELAKSIGDFADRLSEAYPELEPLLNGIKTIATELKQPIEDLINFIVDFIKSEEFQNTLSTVCGWVAEDLRLMVEHLTDIKNWVDGTTFGYILRALETIHDWGVKIEKVIWGAVEAVITLIDYMSTLKTNAANTFDGKISSGGFGALNSGGFGALQSGGYASGGITLNASFNVTSATSFDEATARRFADIMSERINENLGEAA